MSKKSKKNKHPKKPRPKFLASQVQNDVNSWLEENGSGLPETVKFALSQYLEMSNKLQMSKAQLASFLVQLRKSLGITASSEKKSSSSGKKKKKPTPEELAARKGDHSRLEDWHKIQARKHRNKAKKIEDRLKKLEDIELTEEELAENKKESAAYIARLNLGEGAVEPALESTNESFMTGMTPSVVLHEIKADVSEQVIAGREVLDRFTETRERFDFSLEIGKNVIEVEKVILKDTDGERIVLSASTSDIGPEGYSVTWGFLSTLATMVSQFAIPLNRVASMLSSSEKKFTAAMLSKHFQFVASRLAPVYMQLFRDLSTSDLLSGDDTSCRVTEVSRYYKGIKGSDLLKPPPWSHYASKSDSIKNPNHSKNPLGVYIGEFLDFVSSYRSGSGNKTSLQTTVVSGRKDPSNPDSAIVFYRSHFGGFGNLLDQLLHNRPEELREIIVQGDLSQVNLVSDPNILSRFSIDYAACASHARRPFAIYEDQDPDNCAYMLHMFKGIYICEDGLDLYGRNEQNVKAVRQIDEKAHWQTILEIAHSMKEKWSPKTELGQGCNYIIKHFDKLTHYLNVPRLSPDNNFSERALRVEKMIQASALFRTSLEGRFALDIVRSVIQTTIMSKVDVDAYLKSVMMADQEEVRQFPERFTPYSHAQAGDKTV